MCYAAHTYEITDSTVNKGGIDTSLNSDLWLIDSVGQNTAGISHGTGAVVAVTLASGYRFPVTIPRITDITFDAQTNGIYMSWEEDVDYIWKSTTNTLVPNGELFALNADDAELTRTALTSYFDFSHAEWNERYYRIAFEDEFANDVVGKITRNVVQGWNFLSYPLVPRTNTLHTLFKDQLNPGQKISYPLCDVIYSKAYDSELVLPNYYVSDVSSNTWNVLQSALLDLNRAFYLRLNDESSTKYVVFTGFVPQNDIRMDSLVPGWNLVANPFPANVNLNDTGLIDAGLQPGELLSSTNTGDAIYSQIAGDINTLIPAFLRKNESSYYWTGPMKKYLEPGNGYWIYVSQNSQITNWIFSVPYRITPVEL